MHPLTRHYIHQAGGGGGIGPIYSLPTFIHSGHGIGDYLGPLFRVIKPWLFTGAKAGAKAIERAALQTGSHILSEIADNPEGYKDIISKHIRETLPAKMAGGRRRKRKRPPSGTRRPSAIRRKRSLPRVSNLGRKNLSEKVGLLGPYKKRHFCVTQSINQSGMAEIPSYISTEFDLFERKARQDGCLETTETIYKPIASVDQKDIEFLIPADSDSYIDPNKKLFIRGKLIKTDGTNLAETDYVAGVNNLLHSLFNVQFRWMTLKFRKLPRITTTGRTLKR